MDLERKDMALSPKEIALHNEGESLLKAIAESSNKASAILGPDGNPVEATAAEKEAAVKERIEKQNAAFKDHYTKLHKRLCDVADKDPVANECLGTLLAGYRMISWAKLELASCDEITDDLIEYADAHMRRAIETAPPYHLRDLLNNLKHNIAKFMLSQLKEYENLGAFRAARIKKLGLNYQKVLKVPKVMSSKFPEGLNNSRMVVLYGDKPSIDTAMTYIADFHSVANKGRICMLEGSVASSDDSVLRLTPSWWNDAATSLNKLDDVLAPALDDCTLLTVSELSKMYTSAPERSEIETKSLAMKRLYQWGLENLMPVVVGDVVTGECNPAFYAGLVSFYVSKDTEKGLMFDGEPVVMGA